MTADLKPARARYPDPPFASGPEDIILYLQEFMRALELNDIAMDAVLSNHAALIDPLVVEQETDYWDDIQGQAAVDAIDSASTRINFDYEDVTVDFAANARYPNEPMSVSRQLRHGVKEGTQNFGVHLHWIQEEDADPNWVVAHRYFNNGDVPGAWTLAAPGTLRVFTYAAGITQITAFPAVALPDVKISGFWEVKLYRDTANATGLFAGSDTYSVAARIKSIDTHAQFDLPGSSQEFTK